MKLAFDGRVWEKPVHSFRRVLRLLFDASLVMGWEVEVWINERLQPEFQQFSKWTRLARKAREDTHADILWSPDLDVFPAAIPTVATVHDINPLLPDGRWALVRWRRGYRFRSRVRNAFDRAWRVATDSENARACISSEFPRYARKLAVVPLYAHSDFRRVDSAERDRRLCSLGLSPGFILFLGSLRRHKNWDGLMRSYAALPDSLRKQHPLVLAGPAHRALKKVRRLADLLGIRNQVHILGAVAEEFVPALYSGATLFVFPSFMEGFGLPPLEAMACGVPVIATNRTSVPEVLGSAPIYVDPASLASITNAMETVINDRNLVDKLIDAGLRRAADFSPERTGTAMQQVLDEL